MRSSSIKSLSVVTALVVSLSIVPRAEAKNTRPAFRGVKAALTQLLSRFGIRTQEDLPMEPIPGVRPTSTTTSSTTTKDLSPTALEPK